ncbi:MAG: efflux RND transporter periplasmic adaptor subunit [Chitinivibrionales bacterium]|nr:efflux RND transporter periplasmic adaptor subunit [Chitinivibrionales bacterium]
MIKQRASCILASLSLAAALAGCGPEKNGAEQASDQPNRAAVVTLSGASVKAIGLVTEKVTRKPFVHTFIIPAKVTANQDNEAQVGSLVSGRVCKVFVKTGDIVKAGQELMLVEGLEIGEIKAGFLSAKANLEYQKSNYERQKKLLEENVGAQKTLLETLNEFQKARAEYNAWKNKINAVELSVDDVTGDKDSLAEDRNSGTLAVKSPLSGIVVERNVVLGQFIEAATTAFKIVNLNSIWVESQIYEKDIGKINGKAPADFLATAYPHEPLSGKVTYIGQVIDEKTRTITIRAEFNNANGKLKPQMFGELRITDENTAAALTIPAEALVKIDNADFVFIQKEDTSFEKTPVTTGGAQNEFVEILTGINEGDAVVVKGAFYLKSELLKSLLGGE